MLFYTINRRWNNFLQLSPHSIVTISCFGFVLTSAAVDLSRPRSTSSLRLFLRQFLIGTNLDLSRPRSTFIAEAILTAVLKLKQRVFKMAAACSDMNFKCNKNVVWVTEGWDENLSHVCHFFFSHFITVV